MLNRRDFLIDLGRASLILGGTPMLLRALSGDARAAAFNPFGQPDLPPGTPILLNIVLDGGNDALNTLVPVGDPWYADHTYGHGPLALNAAQTLALNGSSYRLHPALTSIAQRFNSQNNVAFIQGIGDSGSNFSHFDMMKMWQTGDLSLLTPSGWMGRFNDLRQQGNAYASMSLYDFRLETLGLQTPAVVVQRASGFYVREPGYPVSDAAFWRQQLLASGSGQSGLLAEIGELTARTYGMSARIVGAANDALPLSEADGIRFYLAQAALLITAGIPCQTYSYALSGFDFHDDLLVRQQERLAALNAGLESFFQVLGNSPRAADVIVLITSEFGRQVTWNRSNGTDHGKAGLAIAFGRNVRGGFYGEAPTLDPGGPTRPNREHDALPVTTNFRRLFAAVLNELGADSGLGQAVFGSGFGTPLPIFAAAGPDQLLRNGFE